MANNLLVIILVFVSLSISSCEALSSPEQPVNKSTRNKEVLTPSFTSSPTIPPLTPTNTSTPIIPTHSPSPSTPTLTPAPASSFHIVASLEGLPVDSTGEVEVYAPADGSVWIISSKSAIRWDGQAWEVILDESEELLASVDDSGQLWMLPQDTSEISTWKDGHWITYTADSGWVGAGAFNESWWATTPWGVHTGKDGTLWVPMEKDVRAFDGARWSVYTLEDMGFTVPEMEDISIVNNLATSKGNPEVWVGQCHYSGPGPVGGAGVRWFDDQAWHGEDSPLGSKCVSALTMDDKGGVWLAASKVVWRYDPTSQSWTQYQMPEDLLSGYNFTHPRQLIIDKSADVWVIEQMCGGASCDVAVNIYRIHNGEWSWIIDAEYWGSSFKQLVLDGNGQGWLFWEGMFYQLGDHPLEANPSIDARGVDVSANGNIWVVAGTGDEASLQVREP